MKLQSLDALLKRKAPNVEFRSLAPGSNRTPRAPYFVLGTFPTALARKYHMHSGLGPPGVWVLSGVDVTGKFSVQHAEHFLWSPGLNIYPQYLESDVARIDQHAAAQRRRRVSGRVALVTGPGYAMYGHWLVESLPKLHALEAGGFPLADLRLLVPIESPPFVFEWLALLGITESQQIRFDGRHEVLEVEELLIPTLFHNGVRMHPACAAVRVFLWERLVSHPGLESLSAVPRKRLFLSRRGGNRRCVNRQHIEQMAQAAGLEVVRPEQLSVIDQIQLFVGAEALVGEYGAALHASLLSAPGTLVCGLRGSGFHPAFIQSGLGEVLHQPTGYVFGVTQPDDPNLSFTIPEDAFEVFLEEILPPVPMEDVSSSSAASLTSATAP
jgi:capsular polysaccharide biosynthesis protein